MSRKDDVKMLLNFMIEMLKDESNETEIVEIKKKEEKQLLTETPKKDESVEKILKVMKRVEDMGKFKKAGIKIVPENERDLIENFKKDKKIIENRETETKNYDIFETLKESKNVLDSIETILPYTPSVPPSDLNYYERNPRINFSGDSSN